MAESGARFVATGEVVGQRPLSQRREALGCIEKRSGLRGLLLRPLCARLLNPTSAELEGLVDRTKLLSIAGRGRRAQLAYASRYGLGYLPPAGGCFLTYDSAARRIADLSRFDPDFSLADLHLLSTGRHFRVSPSFRFVVARDDGENGLLEKKVALGDYVFAMTGVMGPLGIGRGDPNERDLRLCCRILCRFCKARDLPAASVDVLHDSHVSTFTVRPALPEECESLRI